MVAVAPAPARVELARLARDSAASVAGVVGFSSGPHDRWATEDRDGRVPGVICMPMGSAGFRVELHLVAGMTPLPGLAERVRDRLERDAARAGLADVPLQVDIAFEDLDESSPSRFDELS